MFGLDPTKMLFYTNISCHMVSRKCSWTSQQYMKQKGKPLDQLLIIKAMNLTIGCAFFFLSVNYTALPMD